MSRALRESFVKLNPVTLARNPVMFVVEVGALLTTVFLVRDVATGAADVAFGVQICLWLWFTVLFANFAEAMAEARGKAQADTLRKTKTEVVGKKIVNYGKVEQYRDRGFAPATSSCARSATSYPATARSSKGSRRSTSPSLRVRVRR